MDLEIINLILSGLAILSKFRLIIESKEINDLKKSKDLLVFPPQFMTKKLSTNQQQFLKSKTKIIPNLRCQYYEIPYTQFIKLKNDGVGGEIDHERFEILKDYFAIKKLEHIEKLKNVEILLASREEINVTFPIPVEKLSEVNVLKEFGDALIEFESGDLQEKFPIYYSKLLFNELGFFSKSFIFNKTARRDVVSKSTNYQGIKYRNIVLKENKNQFNKIMDLSYENLIALVDNLDLLQKLENNHKEFEIYKEGKDYRKTL